MEPQRDQHFLILASFVFLVSYGSMTVNAAERAAFEPASAYRRLRKDFLVASALPATGTAIRKEHVAYLRSSTLFLQRLSPQDEKKKPYLIAGFSTRGLIFLECGQYKKARQDFDRALALFPPPDKENEQPENGENTDVPPSLKLPAGSPGLTDIQLYRALTFTQAGDDEFVEEIRAVPASKTFFGQDALKKRMWAFAEDLSSKKKFDEAIAVYEVIIKHSLWDEADPSDPRRLIKIMRMQKENTAGQ